MGMADPRTREDILDELRRTLTVDFVAKLDRVLSMPDLAKLADGIQRLARIRGEPRVIVIGDSREGELRLVMRETRAYTETRLEIPVSTSSGDCGSRCLHGHARPARAVPSCPRGGRRGSPAPEGPRASVAR
jgi:hypothetical protein